jgi:hypothetical protein
VVADPPRAAEAVAHALHHLGASLPARLRIARDPAGKDIVPTAEEARRAAEDRIRALEAELARLRDGR